MNTKFLTGVVLAALLSMSAAAQAQDGAAAGATTGAVTGAIVGARDADVGSILGWGFPAALGGVVSQVDTIGIASFVAECDRMAQLYGSRFLPPPSLRDRAARGELLRAA